MKSLVALKGRLLFAFAVVLMTGVQAFAQDGSPYEELEDAKQDSYHLEQGLRRDEFIEDHFVVPDFVQGAPEVTKDILGGIAYAFYSFYTREAWIGLIRGLFALCFVIGITWRGYKLIRGDGEPNVIGLDMIWRFAVALMCLSWVTPHFSLFMTSLITKTTDAIGGIAQIGGEEAEETVNFPPQMKAEIQQMALEVEIWKQALIDTIGAEYESLASSELMAVRLPDLDDQYRDFEAGAMTYGFPGVSWTNPDSIPAYLTLPILRANKTGGIIRPHADYPAGDLYVTVEDYRENDGFFGSKYWAGSGGGFVIRPFGPAYQDAAERTLTVAEGIVESGTPESWARWTDTVSEDTPGSYQDRFRAQLQMAQRVLLIDFVAFVQWLHSPSSYESEAEGEVARSEQELFNKYYAEDYNELEEKVLDSFNERLEVLEESSVNHMGWIAKLVVNLATFFLMLYVVISVWSLPICIMLWSALYMLPEEMELSKALKKGLGIVVTLFFVPIFSALIVEMCGGIMDAVKATMWTGAHSATVGVGGGSIIGAGASLLLGVGNPAVALGAAFGGAMMLMTIHIGGWIVCFLLILATPKITQKVVFGAGGFASELMQMGQIGFGIMMATTITQGGRSLGRGASMMANPQAVGAMGAMKDSVGLGFGKLADKASQMRGPST